MVLGEFISLFIILLLGDTLACSVVLMFAVIGVLLTILAYSRLEGALISSELKFTNEINIFFLNCFLQMIVIYISDQLFHVPWSYVLSWGLMSSYFFYGTGHQPTFSGIYWNAAFIGTNGQFSSNIIPGLLVGKFYFFFFNKAFI